MTRTWWQMLFPFFRVSRTTRRGGPRRWGARRTSRLRFVCLEDRLAPATLDVVGGALTFTGTNVANTLTFSRATGNYTFDDPLDPITLGAGATAAGFTVSGGGAQATGPAAAVTSLTFTLGTAANTLNLGTFDAAIAPLTVTGGGNAGSTATVVVGGIGLTAAGAVSLTGFQTITLNNQVTATGSTLTLVSQSALTVSNTLTATNGVTLTTQAGDLAVNAAVAGGAGPVRLTAGGAESLLTNASAITGGSAVLTANRMALATGTVNVGAGTATLRPSTAGRLIDLGGAADPNGLLTLAATELNTITAAGGLLIGDPTTGNITVTSPIAPAGTTILTLTTAGSILDGTAAEATDIVDTTLNLNAGVAIGAAGAGNLDVNATTLNAGRVGGAAGINVFVNDTVGGVAVGTIDAGSGNVTLSSAGGNLTTAATSGATISAPGGTVTLTVTGAVVSSTPAGVTDVAAANLAVTATTGIGSAANPLKTAVTNLAFNNTGGLVNVTNTGSLTIASVAGLATSTNTGTTTTLVAASPIIFSVNTTSAGTLTATATDSAATGDDITVNANITVQSTAGDVNLRAGDNVTLNAGSLVQAAGAINIAVDFGNADPGVGGTATFAGASLSAPGGATVTGGADNDTFNLSPSATTAIAVDGAAGTDTLNLNALNNPVTITGNAITAGALRPVTFANVESIVLSNNTSTTINGTAGNDNFVLTRGAAGPQVTLNGGPTIAVGNAPLTLDGLGGTNAIVIDFSNGNPFPTGGVTFANITAFTVNGTAGDDTLILQRSGANIQFSLNGGPFINLPGVTSFQFNGLAGNDTMRILYAGGDPVPAGGVVFDGGAGANRLGVSGDNAGFSATYTPSATTPGSGTVVVNGHTIAFQNLAPLDLSGMVAANVLFPNANDVVTVQNGVDFTAGGTNPALQVSGTTGGVAFETVALFGNTTVNLNTTTVDGNDTVTVASANNAHNNTNFNIITGVGTDVVAVNGALTLAGTFTVASQQINVNAPITSTGAAGGVIFTNGGTLTINNTTINSQGNVTQNGAGGVTLTGNVAITTNPGAIAFQSPIAASAGTNQFTSTGNGAVTFNGTYTGPANVTVTTGGVTTFQGAVSVASLTTDAAGRTDINGGAVATTGDQTYNDPVTLTANTVLTGVNVTFAQTVNSDAAATPRALTVNASGATVFGGAVGTTFALASLTTDAAGTTAVNGGAVVTTGAQAYNDPVTVGAAATQFTSTGNAAITFGGAFNGASAITVTTGGLTTFASAVGNAIPLVSLTTNGGGITAINGGLVATTGAQNYGDNVTLGAAATQFTSAAGPITFGGTLTGASAVTVNNPGVTTFLGGVNVTSITTDAPGRTDINGGTVTTTGDQTYNDPVTLTANTVLTGANVTFAQTVNSDAAATPRALTVNASGATVFGGAVGTTFALASLTTDAPGTTAVNGGAVVTAGAQAYSDPVTVGAAATQFTSTGNAAITFGSTLNGASAVTVTTGGLTTFAGAVGNATPLTSLTTNGGGTTAINGGLVATTGAQNYGDNVTLGAAATQFTSAAGPITFNGTLTGASAVTVTNPAVTAFLGAVNVTSLTTDTPGRTDLNGGIVTTTGDQTYNDVVVLTADTTINAVNVTFAQTVNSDAAATPRALTVNATGATVFGGAVGTGFALAALMTDAPGTTAVNGGVVVTIGAQAYNDPVTVGAAATQFFSTGNAAILFGSTLNGASAVTVTTGGLTTFTGAVGNATPLTSLTTNGGGTTAVNGGLVSTTGDQSYSDAVTVGAAATLFISSTGAITFGSSLNGASAVTVTAPGLTTFGGPVGNTTPLTSLQTDGGGVTAINGGSVTTTNFQTYTDDVTLGSATGVTTLDTSTAGGNLTFGGTLNGAGAAGSQCLAIRAGTGNVLFQGAVGATVALGDLVVASARDVTFASTLTAADYRQAAGTGTTQFNGTVTVNAPVALDVTTSAIILNANITATNASSSIRLNAQTGGVNQTAGALTAHDLQLSGTGVFNLPNAGNDVTNLAANINGPLTYQDANSLTVTQVTVAAVNMCGVATTGGAFNGITTTNNDALIRAGGALQFNGPLMTGTGTGRLQGMSVVQAATGTITAARLGVRATGGIIRLDQANTVPIFAAENAAFGAGAILPINFRTTGALQIDSVTAAGTLFNAINGVTNNQAGSPVLLQTGGNLTQTAVGLIVAPNLGIRTSAGNITLDQQNRVGTLAALDSAAGGSILYVDDDALIVGTVLGDGTFNTLRGISTSNGNVTLRTGTNFATDAADTNFADPLFKLGTGIFTLNPGLDPLPANQNYTISFNAEIIALRAFLGFPAPGDVPAEQPNNTPPASPPNAFRDTFNVRPSALITDAIYVNGNLPTTVPGDALSLFLSGQEQGLVFTPGTVIGSGMITFTNRRTVFFTGIESLPQLSIAAFSYLDTKNQPQLVVTGQLGGLTSGQPFTPVAASGNAFVVAPQRVNPFAPIAPPSLAVGDVNGDGIPDLIIAGGSGFLPVVTVISGQKLFGANPSTVLAATDLLAQFYAYDPNFLGGVFVATGDRDADGRAEIITGAGAGGGPHVRTFTFNPAAPAGSNITQFAGPLGSFFAYAPSFTGGVRVASADVNGDGRADIITGAGPGGGPHVKVFDSVTGATIRSFFAYDPTFTGGVFVAAGDFDRDGKADILTGPGVGGGPHVKVFSGATGATLISFLAFPPSGITPFPGDSVFFGGVGGVSFFIDNTGIGLPNDIVVTSGPGRPLLARVFRGTLGNPVPAAVQDLVNATTNIPNATVHNLNGGLVPGITPGLP
jgi:hypothetical protein